MRQKRLGMMVRSAAAVGLLTVSSGCAILNVDLTSAPDEVHGGEIVTFDLKVTNASPCPVAEPAVALFAFIPVQEFFPELGALVTGDLTPEAIAFLEQLRMFFDELCSGGGPEFPTPPDASMVCDRGDGEVVCTASGPLGGHVGNSGGMSFAVIGNRLSCEVDDGTIRCELRFPLPPPSASGGGALATKSLSCFESGGDDLGNTGAICFVGNSPAFEGLDPGQMATGQVMLPAVGEGFVRNLAIGFTLGGDIGVCKGGSSAGDPCATSDACPGSDCDCPGSTCGEGICVGGNDGMGCDRNTEGADCGAGTCEVCNEPPETGFFPIDCTTTYIAPQLVPVMAPWGLAGLSVLLFASGCLWLRRRAAVAGRSWLVGR